MGSREKRNQPLANGDWSREKLWKHGRLSRPRLDPRGPPRLGAGLTHKGKLEIRYLL